MRSDRIINKPFWRQKPGSGSSFRYQLLGKQGDKDVKFSTSTSTTANNTDQAEKFVGVAFVSAASASRSITFNYR